MPDVNKNKGGKESTPVKQPLEAGKPKNTGNQSAPKSDHMNYEGLHGFGGSNKGAH